MKLMVVATPVICKAGLKKFSKIKGQSAPAEI
jgi:hypothetical protein